MKSINITTRLLYLISSIGFILFLGSLFSFIILNFISEEPTVTSTYWQRLFVEKMTYTITISGLILIVIGTLGYLKKDRPFSTIWAFAALILLVLLVLNTVFFVVPTVNVVNNLALQQLHSNVFLDEYTVLKTKEDIFGAINILITIGLLFIIIFQSKKKD